MAVGKDCGEERLHRLLEAREIVDEDDDFPFLNL